MAAINPRQEEPDESRSRRPTLVSPPATSKRGSRWIWIVGGIIVLAVIAAIGYMLLYNGGSGSGGGSGGGGSGGGGLGYVVLAFSMQQVRRFLSPASARIRNHRSEA